MLGRAGGSRMSKCRRRDSAMHVIGDGRVYKMEVRNKEQSVSGLAGSEAGFLEAVDAASIVCILLQIVSLRRDQQCHQKNGLTQTEGCIETAKYAFESVPIYIDGQARRALWARVTPCAWTKAARIKPK